jgi:RNA polymerase sigma factor (sigma-70 family)
MKIMDTLALSRWLTRLASVLRRGTDRCGPEDFAQEVCVEFARAPEDIRAGTLEHAKPWARQVLVSKIADHRRYEGRGKRDGLRERPLGAAGVEDRLADPGPSPSWTAGQKEMAAILRDAVCSLTAHQKEVVRLHHLEQLTFAQIAVLKGISTASVSRLNTRALRALGKIVSPPPG